MDNVLLQEAAARRIPVLSEIELASAFFSRAVGGDYRH